MVGPLAVGQQVLYERIVARAGPVVRVEHPDSTGTACGGAGSSGHAGDWSCLTESNRGAET